MDISTIIRAPVASANYCWETACQNKKTIAAVTVGTTAIAAVACLISNRNELLSMRDKLFEVAKNPSDKIYSKHTEPGFITGFNIDRCPSSFKRYEITIDFPEGETPSPEQLARVEGLYNEATSNGANVFSKFGYYAGRSYTMDQLDRLMPLKDIETYKFVICRENLSTRFFSNLEQISSSSLDIVEAGILGTRQFLQGLTQKSMG